MTELLAWQIAAFIGCVTTLLFAYEARHQRKIADMRRAYIDASHSRYDQLAAASLEEIGRLEKELALARRVAELEADDANSLRKVMRDGKAGEHVWAYSDDEGMTWCGWFDSSGVAFDEWCRSLADAQDGDTVLVRPCVRHADGTVTMGVTEEFTVANGGGRA